MRREPVVALSLVGLTVLTTVAVVAEVGSPLQPLLVALFLLLAPGTAVLLGTQSWPVLVQVTAVLSASVAIDVVLVLGLFYAGWWSPTSVLACLVVLCLGCATASLRRQGVDA